MKKKVHSEEINVLMDYVVTITKVDNGFIVTWLEETNEECNICYTKRKHVFEEGKGSFMIGELHGIDPRDLAPDEVTMYNLLHFIKEHFGIYRSKHANINLEITFSKKKEEEK